MINETLYKDLIDRISNYRLELKYNTMGTEVLLLSLMDIEDSLTKLILEKLLITKDKVLAIINEMIIIRDEGLFTNSLLNVLKRAKEIEKDNDYIYDEAYLYSLLENKNCVAMNLLSKFKIEGKDVIDEVNYALNILGKEDMFLINLTKKARTNELNPFIGRDEYINKIDIVLNKKQKNNVMLLGEAGVGKSGIVEGMAKYYLKKSPNTIIYQLDLAKLLSGTRYRGDLEERLINVLEDIIDDDVVLFIDEVHNIVNNSNNESTIDIANLLKPYLARDNLKMIAATTINEYYKTIANDKALARRFKNITVYEPSEKETLKILSGIMDEYMKYYNIIINNDILKEIINASFILSNLNNPDKSIDILDECGAYTVKDNKQKITKNIIKKVIFQYLNINTFNISNKIKKKDISNYAKDAIKNYFSLKKSNVIFQETINQEKLETYVKSLKDIFNLSNESILEIDALDYLNEASFSTLLGTSPGYVGYLSGGVISRLMITNNITLIIFKNVKEKSLINERIIKRIINSGSLIDYSGRKLKFNNSIILIVNKKDRQVGYKI